MFNELSRIVSRPEPYEFYTAADLWTDEYTSQQMLACHLDDSTDLSSRRFSFIDQSVDWIIRYFDLQPGDSVADFGCGPGHYTSRLARKNINVTGIDFSQRSIDYARKAAEKEGLTIRYITQNYLEYQSSDYYNLIMMIYCDFCALSPEQRSIMLKKFSHHLKTGGHVLLDAYTLNAYHNREESSRFERNLLNGFWSPNEYFGFLNVFKYDQEKVILDKYTIIEADRTRTIYNWLQYFSIPEIKKEFSDNGLEIECVLNDVAGTPFSDDSFEMAVIAVQK